MPTTNCHTLACDPTAPDRARAWARGQLGAAPTEPAISASLVEDALLCVSELVTNALQASCEYVCINVGIDLGRVRIVVTDDARGWPTMKRPGPNDPNGRGLMIIDAIAESWGVERIGPNKAVWAELEAS